MKNPFTFVFLLYTIKDKRNEALKDIKDIKSLYIRQNMEEKKDSYLSDRKSQENTELLSKPKNRLFFSDSPRAFIFKKTEKITLALYLITSLLSESEPLKKSIRQKSLALLHSSAGLKDLINYEDKLRFLNLTSLLFELLSLLSLGEGVGLISSMNFSILSKEIEVLLDFIEKEQDENEDSTSLFGKGFFSVENTPSVSGVKPGGSENKRHFSPLASSEINKNMSYKTEIGREDTNVSPGNLDIEPKEYSVSFIKKSNRKANIVDIIKIKKKVTIKDISSLIKDCSEKTIQRELISLLAEGIVKREGERRWSTYSLA